MNIRQVWILLFVAGSANAAEPTIEFNRDVRPILSENCFACHGPDTRQRKADLRLDVEKIAKAKLESGDIAIVPGKPQQSEMLARILATDDLHMPPADTGKKLSPTQIDILTKWIEQGAKWQDHWSFRPIQKPARPTGVAPKLPPIDAFIQARRPADMPVAPQADRVTLIRRLTFDLIGLPPTPAEVDDYVKDMSPDATEKLIDRLLASPHYGERMAMFWLDIVRYADSVGYHGDQEVSVWPFRDYVIDSFNTNKRFDEFTIEQLAGDLLPNPTATQKIASAYNRLGMMSAEGGVQPKEYLAKYAAERVRALGGGWLGLTTGCAECHDHKFDPLKTRDFYRLEAFFADIQERGLYSGGNFGTSMMVFEPGQEAQLQQLEQAVQAAQAELNAKVENSADLQAKWEVAILKDEKAKLAEPVKKALAVPAEKRNAAQQKLLREQYQNLAPELKPQRDSLQQATKKRDAFRNQLPTTLITVPVSPREIRVLNRGNWMDTTGEIVSPGTPDFLVELPSQGEKPRLNRLDLAQWLMSRDNPLTARVFVNRLWKLYFGQGLSRKLDDLGSQGEPPTHPELLDYLAQEFIDSGWNIKAIIKAIVLSETYQLSSQVAKADRDRDPTNRYLARQEPIRLNAEMIRDNALAVAGLLNTKIGGASAKPYQPPGYWSFLNFPKREWKNDQGAELYRRGLYTHWQRQYLHPSLMLFDAPSREECTPDRVTSNTPLQSLALLNAPEYVEAARALAQRVLTDGGKTVPEQLSFLFTVVLSRPIREQEQQILVKLHQDLLAGYQANPIEAKQLLAIGAKPVNEKLSVADLATWTNLCRTILNLHATVTRY